MLSPKSESSLKNKTSEEYVEAFNSLGPYENDKRYPILTFILRHIIHVGKRLKGRKPVL